MMKMGCHLVNIILMETVPKTFQSKSHDMTYSVVIFKDHSFIQIRFYTLQLIQRHLFFAVSAAICPHDWYHRLLPGYLILTCLPDKGQPPLATRVSRVTLVSIVAASL